MPAKEARHRWVRHGGYSLLARIRRGALDNRTKPAKDYRTVCQELTEAVGFERLEEVPIARRLLIQRAASIEVAIAAMETFTVRAGAWETEAVESEGGKPGPVRPQKGVLRPVLGQHFLAFVAEQRRLLTALGLTVEEGDKGEAGLDAGEMIVRARRQMEQQED